MAQTWKRCKLLGNSHAEVYLAIDKITGRLFVVKTIDTDKIKATAELLNEITIFLMLNSPQIVQYLGSSFTEERGKLRLNMFVEYMPGGNLRNHISRIGAPLTEILIQTYTRSILEGLHHVHTRGIVHGDVKSDNVLVGLSKVKLADFGGSKLVGDNKSMKGTSAWMAPEVVAGVEQGFPSDIWSLGCTILEMATGLDPWYNIPSTRDVRRVIQYSNSTPTIPSTLSIEGQQFLRKCLVRDPSKRSITMELLQEPFLTKKIPIGISPSHDNGEHHVMYGGTLQSPCILGDAATKFSSFDLYVAPSPPLQNKSGNILPHPDISTLKDSCMQAWTPELEYLISLGLTKSEWDDVYRLYHSDPS